MRKILDRFFWFSHFESKIRFFWENHTLLVIANAVWQSEQKFQNWFPRLPRRFAPRKDRKETVGRD